MSYHLQSLKVLKCWSLTLSDIPLKTSSTSLFNTKLIDPSEVDDPVTVTEIVSPDFFTVSVGLVASAFAAASAGIPNKKILLTQLKSKFQ